MKRSTILLLLMGFIFSLALFSIAGSMTGCSQDQLKKASAEIPPLAPTTQAVERIEEKVDTLASKSAPVVATGQQVANTASSLGVPYAQYVGLGLGVVGALIAGYQTIRKGQSDSAAGILGSALANIGAPASDVASNALDHAQSVAPSLTLPPATPASKSA